jgi:hypothetical protein
LGIVGFVKCRRFVEPTGLKHFLLLLELVIEITPGNGGSESRSPTELVVQLFQEFTDLSNILGVVAIVATRGPQNTRVANRQIRSVVSEACSNSGVAVVLVLLPRP